MAWDGIEPSTRGFSIAMLVKNLAFMRVISQKCVMCDRLCYSEITEFRDTVLFYQREKMCQVFLGFGNCWRSENYHSVMSARTLIMYFCIVGIHGTKK